MARYIGDDGWDINVRGRRVERTNVPGAFPAPDPRSHSPINIYNYQVGNEDRHDQHGGTRRDYQAQYPYGPPPVGYVAVPDNRGFGNRLEARIEDQLAANMADLAFDRRDRGRSPRSGDTAGVSAAALAELKLAQQEEKLKELERKREYEREVERIQNKYKLTSIENAKTERQLKEEAEERAKRAVETYQRTQQEKADAEKEASRRTLAEHERKQREDKEKAEDQAKRALEEYQRKQREAEDKAKETEKRILFEHERKVAEEKTKAEEEERRIKEKMEREAKEKKEKEEQAYKDFVRKQKEDKEEEERKYNEFLRIQKEKEDEKRKEKEKEEERLQSEMRKRLSTMGFDAKTIDVLVDEEKAKKYREEHRGDGPHHNPMGLELYNGPSSGPVYPKIHRDYLDVETLQFYGLPWDYDKNDRNYIIIMRHMEKRETDVLFEHTQRRRNGLLTLEPAKKGKELAWVRKRSRSRGAPVKLGIVELRR